MANSKITFYKSHKGMVDVDDMDEVHLRNVLKKLIRDKIAPEGEELVEQVDAKLAAKALSSLNTAKTSIATMGLSATEEGEAGWQKIIDGLSQVQVLLNQYTDASANEKKGKAA